MSAGGGEWGGWGRVKNTFLFYSTGNYDRVHKTATIVQGMLELACTGLINFQKFCKSGDIKLVF